MKIRAYFKLGRIHSAVLTGLAPVCAAAAIGKSLSLLHYFELFFIGFLFHIYLFVFNEVHDVEIDKTSKSLAEKPLVDGSVSLKNAKLVVVTSVVLIFVLTFVFFFEQAFILMPIGGAALIFGGLYDHLGKRVPHADYFIALMIFFVAIYGGFSVLTDLSLFVYVIALLALVQMLINNIIAGLKDVDHDYVIGGLSTSLRMGVRLEGEHFLVSTGFIGYVVFLKIVHSSLVIFPFLTHLIPFESWQFYIVLILIVITVIFMVRFLTIKIFHREKITRAIGFHEMFAFMVIPFLLLGNIGYEAAVILVLLPVIWLGVFLFVMYGKLMPAI